MRPLTLFVLFISLNAVAQNSAAFRLDSLPQKGVLLDKCWKFKVGDHPDFAKANFDDSAWESINPTLDVHDALPQIPRPSGVCWFRLHLIIDKNVLKNQLALRIYQSGAAEIYENGSLVRKLGLLSSNPNEIKAFDPLAKPMTFNRNNDTSIVLAIRYTLQPNVTYTLIYAKQNPALRINLNTSEKAFSQYTNWKMRDSNSTIIRIGIFFIILTLCFSYYLYSPEQKSNLYFSIYALLMIIYDIISITPNAVHSKYYQYNVGLDAQQLGIFLSLTALYTLFNQKTTWIYWSLLGLTILGVLGNAWSYHWGNMFSSMIIGNLINFDIVRLTLKSIKIKKRGAWIIAVGGIFSMVFWIAFLLSAPWFLNYVSIPFMGTIYTLGDVLYNVALLSIPVSVCVYLGLHIANTNRTLRKKLGEVESLSAEKQQILANQNETLEKLVKERTATLQSTQAQLIQSEKLASLGELTAGIAHEIQNPLNFVNNFAEVSAEMLDEMHEELEKGDTTEAIAIATDLKTNLEKINHHGQRASSIVKGMLEHSRASTGVKEPTDINRLADEYLRLAYHGLRAKDNNFNATLETHFDPELPKVSVIPQDIGRVLLNLINNAFWAVAEKAKQGIEGYRPTVTISSRKLENAVEISIKDNGNGIPEAIKDKIFQPFFTTKPTGQGTGLGLSLAYDIATKGHGGMLEAESIVGSGTEFKIVLPV